MSKIILVTGGSRSGKSSFAEQLLKGKDDVLYIATSIITDDEMKERVAVHKKRRNKHWQTFEGYKNLKSVVKESRYKHVLLECATTMMTNLMFDKYVDFDNLSIQEIKDLEEYIKEEFRTMISAVREYDKELVVVTNEVGFGLISEHRLGRIFTDISGRINQYLGKVSDEAYLLVSGLPVKIK
ncbi:MAG: bifunctional adenosylcobinamide kinase/adenosylcobinamide-phosphate guanylyltransferase [Clostridiaceae bacterium]|nr:bifunctional adenosylcobinamide kinase/adenosylcobinamide-phosphate guanylyltransferase [Clostridiaceae bacterium]